MAKWCKLALEYFPDLRNDIAGKDYSIYFLFADLNYKLRESLRENNDDLAVGAFFVSVAVLSFIR